MNTHMLENPITQDNLKTLEHYGFTVIPSGSGLLACGDTAPAACPMRAFWWTMWHGSWNTKKTCRA